MEPTILIILIVLTVATLFNLLLSLNAIHHINKMNSLFHPPPALAVGQSAPDFQAETLDRQIVTRATFDGRDTAFVFISPACSSCRQALPQLIDLAPRIKQNANVDIVLVSEGSRTDTQQMLSDISLNLPVIIAPRIQNEFVREYNPAGMLPYYVVVDRKGSVRSREILGRGDWPRLVQQWANPPAPAQLQPTTALPLGERP